MIFKNAILWKYKAVLEIFLQVNFTFSESTFKSHCIYDISKFWMKWMFVRINLFLILFVIYPNVSIWILRDYFNDLDAKAWSYLRFCIRLIVILQLTFLIVLLKHSNECAFIAPWNICCYAYFISLFVFLSL